MEENKYVKSTKTNEENIMTHHAATPIMTGGYILFCSGNNSNTFNGFGT